MKCLFCRTLATCCVLAAVFAICLVGCTDESDTVCVPGSGGGSYDLTKLNVLSVPEGPIVDGNVDALWSGVPVLTVPLGETYDVHDPASIMDCVGCHNFDSDVKVGIQAVYTADMIYVLTTWNDPTASFTRGGSWEFVDGAWSRDQNSEQSEDRISFFFPITDISGNPYNTGGCMTKCHAYWPTDTDPHVSTHGIVDDAWLASGKADLWHTKSARSGAVLGASGSGIQIDPETSEVISGYFAMLGFADDKRADVWAPDSENGEDGGRYGDAGTSTYSHNRIGDKSRPKFMETAPVDYADAMFLTQDEIDGGECVGDATSGVTDVDAAAYWPNYLSFSAVVPERILRRPEGSRGDIMTGAVWSNGIWTCEMSRALNTGADDDVQFDTAQEYDFNCAAFDNSRHGYEHRTSRTYSLVFVK